LEQRTEPVELGSTGSGLRQLVLLVELGSTGSGLRQLVLLVLLVELGSTGSGLRQLVLLVLLVDLGSTGSGLRQLVLLVDPGSTGSGLRPAVPPAGISLSQEAHGALALALALAPALAAPALAALAPDPAALPHGALALAAWVALSHPAHGTNLSEAGPAPLPWTTTRCWPTPNSTCSVKRQPIPAPWSMLCSADTLLVLARVQAMDLLRLAVADGLPLEAVAPPLLVEPGSMVNGWPLTVLVLPPTEAHGSTASGLLPVELPVELPDQLAHGSTASGLLPVELPDPLAHGSTDSGLLPVELPDPLAHGSTDSGLLPVELQLLALVPVALLLLVRLSTVSGLLPVVLLPVALLLLVRLSTASGLPALLEPGLLGLPVQLVPVQLVVRGLMVNGLSTWPMQRALTISKKRGL